NVTEHLRTSQAEIEHHLRGRGPIADLLADIYAGYYDDHYARSKELWDVGVVAWLVEPAWAPSVLVSSPRLTTEGTWSHDPTRHRVRELLELDRDAILGDLFRKLTR